LLALFLAARASSAIEDRAVPAACESTEGVMLMQHRSKAISTTSPRALAPAPITSQKRRPNECGEQMWFGTQPVRKLGGELWLRAVREAGLDPANISEFGRLIPKFPESVVRELLELSNITNKFRKFNFQGSVGTYFDHCNAIIEKKKAAREWMMSFVRKHFGPQDLLRVVDAPEDYVPLGDFDVSREHIDTTETDDERLYDKLYFKRMAESRFTLCPGSDMPWSMRVYEAVLAGSIPVISNEANDWRSEDSMEQFIGVATQEVFDEYKYVKVTNETADEIKNLAYNPEWALWNLEKFLKFQTFIYGDHEPRYRGRRPGLGLDLGSTE